MPIRSARPAAARPLGGPGDRIGRLDVVAWLVRDVARDVEMGRAGLWLPVGVAAGIGLYFACPFEPALVACLGLAAATVVGTLLARVRPLAFVTLAILASLAVGLAAAALEIHVVATPVLPREGTFGVEGWITEAERRGETRTVSVIEVARIEGLDAAVTPRRIRISTAGRAPIPAVGTAVAVTARLGPPRGPVLPGGYDSARRLYLAGIGGSGFSYGAPKPIALDRAPPRGLGLRAAIDRVRTRAATRIRRHLPGAEGEIAAALLVGERGGIPPGVTEAIRVSGLGHILAISGLHMALVAGTVYAAARALLALVPILALRFPIKKWAAIAGLLAGVGYLLLSGGSVATQRAFVMLSIGFLAVLLLRPALTMRTVAIAALVVMALKPSVVIAPGFQMSFLAVVTLIGAYEWLSSRRRAQPDDAARSRVMRGIRAVLLGFAGLALTSLIAGTATAAVGAYHFYRVAPLGLPANLAAMPVVSMVVMPAGVAALAALPFGLERPPLLVMGAGIEWVIAVAEWAERTGGSAGNVGRLLPAGVLVTVAGLLWLSIWTRPWRLVGAPVAAVGVLLMPLAHRPDVLISDDGRSVASRGADGRLTVLRDGGGTFASEVWLRADGDPRSPRDPGVAASVRCDAIGCTLPVALPRGTSAAPPGRARAYAATMPYEPGERHEAGAEGWVALARSYSALDDDCRRAAIVVTRHDAAGCGDALVIDRRTLAATGSIAITLRDEEGSLDIEVVAARDGGKRPWHTVPTIER